MEDINKIVERCIELYKKNTKDKKSINISDIKLFTNDTDRLGYLLSNLSDESTTDQSAYDLVRLHYDTVRNYIDKNNDIYTRLITNPKFSKYLFEVIKNNGFSMKDIKFVNSTMKLVSSLNDVNQEALFMYNKMVEFVNMRLIKSLMSTSRITVDHAKSIAISFSSDDDMNNIYDLIYSINKFIIDENALSMYGVMNIYDILVKFNYTDYDSIISCGIISELYIKPLFITKNEVYTIIINSLYTLLDNMPNLNIEFLPLQLNP